MIMGTTLLFRVLSEHVVVDVGMESGDTFWGAYWEPYQGSISSKLRAFWESSRFGELLISFVVSCLLFKKCSTCTTH